jgi:hypothetical protein
VSTWAAVLVGGIVSLGSAAGGMPLTWKLGQKQLERDRAEARTQRVAAVLGRMRPLLANLRPEGIATTTAFMVRGFYEDPWTPIRADLGILIASEPEGELRGRLAELEDCVERLFTSLLALVDADFRRQVMDAHKATPEDVFEEAQKQYAETDGLLRGILDDLHGANAGLAAA